MATTFNPFGFLPARKRDGQPNSEGYGQIVQPVSNSAIAITALLPNNIFAGDLIVIDTGGTITPLASTSLKPSGVFQGCQYVENGEPKFSRFFPGGTCVTDVKLHVITDPAQTYYVQADSTLSDGEIGIVNSYTATVSGAAAGSTLTGQSNYRLVGAPVGVAVEIGAHARVVGRKDLDGDSVNGNVTDADQYPIVEVYLSGHRSNFVKAQVSTSV
jgi:hypothetical protein